MQDSIRWTKLEIFKSFTGESLIDSQHSLPKESLISTSYTIVGVIGHIDHGKTSLVGVLTGTDTDTHPEEKRRGITIDLGFASFTEAEHEFALIDAPGHQKYIGNLLAGVSSIDVGLLVVACDQGIQEQTLEHAAILQNLGVTKLIVAISRIDLATEKQRIDLTEELELFLDEYGFRDIPMIPLSSVTGDGLDELKTQLCAYARTTGRKTGNHFRMPIDRIFTVEGRGCVVAGTVWSGKVSVGDALQLAGTKESVRVREIEAHGADITESRVGYRTAMNITGVSASKLHRGDELIQPDTHQPVKWLIVEISMFQDTQELRCPATVQLHTATHTCEARISGAKRIEPGQKAVALVEVENEIVSTFDQQCLFRKPYPIGSFAGARVLGTIQKDLRNRKRLMELGAALLNANQSERLLAWADFNGEMLIDPVQLELQLGISPDELSPLIDDAIKAGRIQQIDNRLISHTAIQRTRKFVLSLLTQQAEETDDAWLVEQSVTQRAKDIGSPAVIDISVRQLVEEKLLVRLNKMLAIASEKTVLSKKQKARMQQIVDMFRDQRSPPTIKEIAAKLETTIDVVSSLVRFATQQRMLTDLGNGFHMATAVFHQLCGELRELFAEQPQQSVAGIRDHWQITRKHAIPLLEYCDAAGITIRQNDVRTAGPKLEQILTEEEVTDA